MAKVSILNSQRAYVSTIYKSQDGGREISQIATRGSSKLELIVVEFLPLEFMQDSLSLLKFQIGPLEFR